MWLWLHGPSWPWTAAAHLPRAGIKGHTHLELMILCLDLIAGRVGLQVCTITSRLVLPRFTQ